jgi:hypothetical protein
MLFSWRSYIRVYKQKLVFSITSILDVMNLMWVHEAKLWLPDALITTFLLYNACHKTIIANWNSETALTTITEQTPRHDVFLEKTVVTLLVKEFTFLWNTRILTFIHCALYEVADRLISSGRILLPGMYSEGGVLMFERYALALASSDSICKSEEPQREVFHLLNQRVDLHQTLYLFLTITSLHHGAR